MQVKNKALLGQVSDVDLRLLRVFKAVADCGSLSAAELELNVAVSTISRHIKDLETRLGLVLCRRGRAGFALTPEGEKVYQATDELFNANQVFRSQIHGIQAQLGGDLHVAMFEKCISNPAAQVAQAIAMFQAMAPTVSQMLSAPGGATAVKRAGSIAVMAVPTFCAIAMAETRVRVGNSSG